MSYIYLEIDRDKDGTINSIEVMRDEDGKIVEYENFHDIDQWLENNNFNVGYEYTRVEI